jgi:hypothetical protein
MSISTRNQTYHYSDQEWLRAHAEVCILDGMLHGVCLDLTSSHVHHNMPTEVYKSMS